MEPPFVGGSTGQPSFSYCKDPRPARTGRFDQGVFVIVPWTLRLGAIEVGIDVECPRCCRPVQVRTPPDSVRVPRQRAADMTTVAQRLSVVSCTRSM